MANGMNATQAAISAKYSKKTAYSQGQRLLKHVEVKKYMEPKMEKTAKKLEITKELQLKRLNEVIERCLQNEPVMEKGDHGMEESGEYKFEYRGVISAIQEQNKMLGHHEPEKKDIKFNKAQELSDEELNEAIESIT
jgi:phage terminase small subunit